MPAGNPPAGSSAVCGPHTRPGSRSPPAAPPPAAACGARARAAARGSPVRASPSAAPAAARSRRAAARPWPWLSRGVPPVAPAAAAPRGPPLRRGRVRVPAACARRALGHRAGGRAARPPRRCGPPCGGGGPLGCSVRPSRPVRPAPGPPCLAPAPSGRGWALRAPRGSSARGAAGRPCGPLGSAAAPRAGGRRGKEARLRPRSVGQRVPLQPLGGSRLRPLHPGIDLTVGPRGGPCRAASCSSDPAARRPLGYAALQDGKKRGIVPFGTIPLTSTLHPYSVFRRTWPHTAGTPWRKPWWLLRRYD